MKTKDELAPLYDRADELRPRVALEPFQHHIEGPCVLAEILDLGDVRVADTRSDTSLVEEHVAERRVGREVRQDGLDRIELLEPMLTLHTRQPHGGHATLRIREEKLVPFVEAIAHMERSSRVPESRHVFRLPLKPRCIIPHDPWEESLRSPSYRRAS